MLKNCPSAYKPYKTKITSYNSLNRVHNFITREVTRRLNIFLSKNRMICCQCLFLHYIFGLFFRRCQRVLLWKMYLIFFILYIQYKKYIFIYLLYIINIYAFIKLYIYIYMYTYIYITIYIYYVYIYIYIYVYFYIYIYVYLFIYFFLFIYINR